MSRIENIQKSYTEAKRKLEAVKANTTSLIQKREHIDLQLKANQEKIKKLTFFLEKTEKTLESKNPK